jgi:hypothetical protein
MLVTMHPFQYIIFSSIIWAFPLCVALYLDILRVISLFNNNLLYKGFCGGALYVCCFFGVF